MAVSIENIKIGVSKEENSKGREELENKKAIIDIGSNTVRLVIFEIKSENIYKEIENIKVSARLQSYVDHEMCLNTEGQKILLETLEVFKEIISLHNISSLKVVATAAIRQARNQKEILNMVHEKIGFSLEVLSGQQEAYYGFLGIINAVEIADGITIDLGGGSVEITQFIKQKVVHCHSFPFGVLSLSQQFVKNKVAANEELEKISSYVNLHFEQMKWLNNCQLPIIGTGGSARNLAEIDQALKSYPLNSIHQYEMNLNDILTVKAKLTALPYEELLRVPGLSKERADIIIPAIEVFLSIYKLVNAPFFRFSQKGIRDGLIYEQINQSNARKNDYNLLQNFYYQMAAEYGMDLEKRKMVLNTVHLLFQSIRANGLADVNENDLHCLHCASYCYGLGEMIARDSAEAHTFYILSNKSIDRLSHRNRIKIAILASYQSKNMFKKQIKPFKEWFTKNERQRLKQLGIILKISYILNSTKREIVQDVHFKKDRNGDLNLDIFCNKSWKVEQIEVEKQIRQIENAFGEKVMINFKLSG